MNRRLRRVLAACVGTLLLAGCAPAQTAAPTIAIAPSPTQCAQTEVLPTIEEVRPPSAKPGDDVTVIASGGYIRDTCGGYIEGARTYQLFLDDKAAADLQCYILHCEAKFTLPESIEPGPHCLSVQKGTCQMELEVSAP